MLPLCYAPPPQQDVLCLDFIPQLQTFAQTPFEITSAQLKGVDKTPERFGLSDRKVFASKRDGTDFE